MNLCEEVVVGEGIVVAVVILDGFSRGWGACGKIAGRDLDCLLERWDIASGMRWEGRGGKNVF